jgi:carboxymethylenebutenolidase
MKTFVFLIFCSLFLLMNNAFSQSCCDEYTTTGRMASFSKDVSFVNSHPEPLAYHLTDGKGKMVTFKTGDGVDGNGYEVKCDTASNTWVFVFHEWYGLNDYIKKEAEEIASTLGNVNVLAIDLYDGKVASNNDEAVKYVQSVNNTRAFTIISGAKDYAGSNALFATWGWCFGGAWSLQAAIEFGSACKSCVIYYGMPEQDLTRLENLKAPVIGIFGNLDNKITPEVVKKFKDDLNSLNKKAEIYSYDAVHAFANPSNPKHDPEATKDAKEKVYAFLKNNLK